MGSPRSTLPSGSAGSARRSTRHTDLRACGPLRFCPNFGSFRLCLERRPRSYSVFALLAQTRGVFAQSTVTIPVVRGVGRARLSVVLKVLVEDVLYVKAAEAVPEYSLSMPNTELSSSFWISGSTRRWLLSSVA